MWLRASIVGQAPAQNFTLLRARVANSIWHARPVTFAKRAYRTLVGMVLEGRMLSTHGMTKEKEGVPGTLPSTLRNRYFVSFGMLPSPTWAHIPKRMTFCRLLFERLSSWPQTP